MNDLPHRPIDRLKRPVVVFLEHRLSGALPMMAAAAAALIWANSPFRDSYHQLLDTEVSISFGEHALAKSLLHWINDGLMGIFFFVVGLEIKREVLTGELATARKAALPAAAALGGMLVPALVFLAFNHDGQAAAGWGVPMATDIAFALGVLALLGDRVPASLKVFLTALAIVDDIGAVLVIAVFYTDAIALVSLALGVGLWGLSIVLNRLHVRSASTYFALGTLVWVAFLESGVHATIAALLMALTIPARSTIDGDRLITSLHRSMDHLRSVGGPPDRDVKTAREQQAAIGAMEMAIAHAGSPLVRLEGVLSPYVALFVLPVFALANAGVSLVETAEPLTRLLVDPLTLGIVAGLWLGKQVGITLSCWLAVKSGLAELPSGTSFRLIHGVALFGGVGFTMALFIAGLAFPTRQLLDQAKLGILVASVLSGVTGYVALYVHSRQQGARRGD